jgi:cell division transport system permease protein
MKTWLTQHRAALTLALRRLRAAPLNSLLSILAIGIALALPSGGYLLLSNLQRLAQKAAPTPRLSLFLSIDSDRRTASELGVRLKAYAGISSYIFLPREQTLARMKKNEGLGDVIDALGHNPFPDAYAITPASSAPEAMEALAAELRGWPKVEHIQIDSAWVRRLDALLNLGRSGLALLAALLGGGLVAITFNTIRLQVLTQRAEIEVSRLLGATDAFIRRPFHYFGALLGLAGGLAAWLIVSLATLALRGPVNQLGQLYALNFDLATLGPVEACWLLFAATLLGLGGAAISLRQHLKQH